MMFEMGCSPVAWTRELFVISKNWMYAHLQEASLHAQLSAENVHLLQEDLIAFYEQSYEDVMGFSIPITLTIYLPASRRQHRMPLYYTKTSY